MNTITHGNWRSTHTWQEGTPYSQGGVAITIMGREQKPVYSLAHPAGWVWNVEILDANTGEYIYPDCAYHCQHCYTCLGCIRKMVFRNGKFDENEMRCADSPTGWHEVAADNEWDAEEVSL